MKRLSRAMWTLSAFATLLCAANATAQSPVGAYANVDDVRLYYEKSGAGPALVLLHGGLENIQEFEYQVGEFSKSHTVIAIEQAGHGRSKDRAAPLSYERMAQDTATLLKQINIENAEFIGHSDGAIVALVTASKYPTLVRRVVASGANTRLLPEATEWFKKNSLADHIKMMPARVRDSYARLSPDGNDYWPTIVEKTRALWATPQILTAEQLAAIQAPVLVVSGDHDEIPLEHSLEIFRALRKGQLLMLPATGHNTFRQTPDLLNPAILKFLGAP